MTTLGLQLYSARNFPPLGRQLALAAACGYGDVEPFPDLYDDPVALARDLALNGLTARSGHYGLDLLESEFERAIGIARTLGNEILVLPFLPEPERPADEAGWRDVGERVARVARRVRDEGLRTAWHNHDFELRPIGNGSACPLEFILDADEAIEWQADLAWVTRAGADPVRWLRRYRGRVAALHVKDLAPPGENRDEDGWADVGEGTMDWTALWRAGREAGAMLMIAEHDEPADFERFARRSAEAMRRFREER